jgi:hypothetical protein
MVYGYQQYNSWDQYSTGKCCRSLSLKKTQVATLKSNRARKPLFAANYTDFREFEKKSVQISEIRGKGFRFISR